MHRKTTTVNVTNKIQTTGQSLFLSLPAFLNHSSPSFPLLLPLVFSAKCLQRRLSCIWGLKSLFSPLTLKDFLCFLPRKQTSIIHLFHSDSTPYSFLYTFLSPPFNHIAYAHGMHYQTILTHFSYHILLLLLSFHLKSLTQ